eukprot:CAMPEP_0183438284 /NCGR_PEP_ID=MMETSP0370-20130417/77050_1 /TAXON_ID=268820 /ORGANISM="Peridinium aciculiferum, Strain PAER-2" /LENGTH=50 /DNA_ID=CAMNT_0025626467 /DNA_START=18 /DNA_END=170 /DNA_ORIENTATION=+
MGRQDASRTRPTSWGCPGKRKWLNKRKISVSDDAILHASRPYGVGVPLQD